MNADEMLQKIMSFSQRKLISFMMDNSFLKREQFCVGCCNVCSFTTYKRNSDHYAWRCMNKICVHRKKYFSIRKDSFFEPLNIDLKTVLRILICYSTRTPRYSIISSIDICEKTIRKVINLLIEKIPVIDFVNDKLGGPGCIVQIDETMLNFKCKSHRGRSPENRTDSLCIVEVRGSITRAFATIIPNKESSTLIPIICRQVAQNSIIHTDEHRSYTNLHNFGFVHDTVCHKYSFINAVSGANTQAVECFHNELKLAIKSRKGVKTLKRQDFLKEFLFYFNHRNNLFFSVFQVIKL